MGIVVNQRAEEIEFAELLVQLDIVTPAEAIDPAAERRSGPGAARRSGRDRTRLRAALQRLSSPANSTVKIAEGVCLTATLDILRAIAKGDGAATGGAGAGLRRLGVGAVGERNSRQRAG